MEVARQEPHTETDWDAARLLLAGGSGRRVVSAADSNIGVCKLPLLEAVQQLTPADMLATISWTASPGRQPPPPVLLTENFWRTCSGGGALNEYLRAVDGVVCFSDGSVLLLSDRELDKLLEAQQALRRRGDPDGGRQGAVEVLRFSFARDFATSPSWRSSLPAAAAGRSSLTDSAVVRIQLFNGETMFGSSERRLELSTMLATPEARGAAPLLPQMRGYGHLIARSHLIDAINAAEAAEYNNN